MAYQSIQLHSLHLFGVKHAHQIEMTTRAFRGFSAKFPFFFFRTFIALIFDVGY